MAPAQPSSSGEADRARLTKAEESGYSRKRIYRRVNRLRLPHPGFWPDAPDPVGERRNEAEIFADMLLADQPDGDDTPTGNMDCRSEEPLEHEDALRMMAECSMAEVRSEEHTSALKSLMRLSY